MLSEVMNMKPAMHCIITAALLISETLLQQQKDLQSGIEVYLKIV